MDVILRVVCDELVRAHGAHTVLLYGSRADDTANDHSDYDIASFAPVARSMRDTRPVEGSYLDVFVHPEAALTQPTTDHLMLRGSRVLLQRGDEADRFLASLDALYETGPEPLPADETQARVSWVRKMALRMRRGDVEGHYRRAWLLTALLEDYFVLRTRWYEGPKKALQWLRVHDPRTYRAFEAALQPDAAAPAIDVLVERVVRLQNEA